MKKLESRRREPLQRHLQSPRRGMLSNTRITMKTIYRSNKGQGMVEYILIVGLIALLVFAAVKTLGTSIKSGFTAASGQVTAATGNW